MIDQEVHVKFKFPQGYRGNVTRGTAIEMEPHGRLKDGTEFRMFKWQGNSLRKYWGLSFRLEEEVLALPAKVYPRSSHFPRELEFFISRSELLAWASDQASLISMGYRGVRQICEDLCLVYPLGRDDWLGQNG